MASELHDRLEYLVNYSSQLIFVSGDSIAEQQRTLESFVFQQADNTELAFITANETMQVADYRRDVCRQLLGQVVGSFVRPLNELLAELNHHNGPVLITITNAQFLPNQFLQELWELVLQSRFANNKQHLNVLLFGESEWAEQAKQWLPAKNTDTPLLISSQSVSRDSYGSEVDKLLAQRRAAFERYRQAKGLAHIETRPNRLRSPLVWLVISAVFISSFVALLGWQYGATLSTLFNPIEQHSDSANVHSANEVALSSQASLPSQTISVPMQTDSSDDTTLQAEQTNNRVVSSFSDAMNALPTQSEIVEQQEDTVPELTAAASLPTALSTSSATESDPAKTEQSQDVSLKEDTHEQASVAMPSQQPEATLSAEAITSNDAADTSVVSLLSAVDAASYYIQIAGMKDLPLATSFLNDHNLTSNVTVYKTTRYGGDWYVLLWQTSAASLQQARGMIAALPAFPGRDTVFVKSGRQIQRELNASN
ncbi:cell division protein DamX [Aestuariibacter sp. GS-14]|uniref:SPOR domain-containing protein n=1 Tax=Aestuariibacter sp. GS-14 TaxID=2590670 RepID=UPI0011279A1C|nr:AAA family ATPase [Aestuariibacter sp. GS-14]TPV58404.1 cell division protein DamX [Aestuariibacter sp. GS-14]